MKGFANMSKLTSITDNKILELLNALFNTTDFSKSIIERNLKEDIITISLKGGSIKLTKWSIANDFASVGTKSNVLNIYEKWLVANHRHPLQDNNPFIHYAVLDKLQNTNQNKKCPECPDSIYTPEELKKANWLCLCDEGFDITNELCAKCNEQMKGTTNG